MVLANEIDGAGGLLAGVSFNPNKSVTYRPIPSKQMAEVTMSNDEASPIIYKWKSTRPGVYKMRPVYGVLNIGEKAQIKLFYKGLKEGQPPLSDRFTCVMAATSSANVNPENVWKNHKYQQKLAQGGQLRKKKLYVLFAGINDQEPPDETQDEKDKVGKMKKKKKEEGEDEAAAPPPASKGKKPVVMMFMRDEGESISAEEEEPSPVGKAVVGPDGEMQTTLLASGIRKMQTVNPKTAPMGAVSDMKTVNPAEAKFNNLQQRNPGANPSGATLSAVGQVKTANSQPPTAPMAAGAGPPPGDRSDLRTTAPAPIKFNNLQTPNTPTALQPPPQTQDMKTVVPNNKKFNNPQIKNN